MNIEDPSENLQKTIEKCERIYAFFLEITTKWLTRSTIVMPMISILLCRIKYGHIDVAQLFHPFTLR